MSRVNMQSTSSPTAQPGGGLRSVLAALGGLLRGTWLRLVGGTRLLNNGRNDGPPDLDELWRDFNRERGTTFLVVTHDQRLAERCDRIVQLVDGRIVSDVRRGLESRV